MAPARLPPKLKLDRSRSISPSGQSGRRINSHSGRIQKIPQQHRSDPLNFARIAAASKAADPTQELSFDNEYRIKNGIQALLEEAMFFFCQKHFPRLLEDQQWHTPLMGELNIYSKSLRENKYDLGPKLLSLNRSSRKTWPETLAIIDELKHIRHSAVHRIYWGLQKLQGYISLAVSLLEAIQDTKRHAKMVMIRDETITKQWAAVFEAINMPLESVPVKPWYGKEVKILDLTEDDKDEDLAPVPAPASVSAMLQKDRNIEKVVKKVSMGMPDIKGEAGEAEAGKAAILGAGLQDPASVIRAPAGIVFGQPSLRFPMTAGFGMFGMPITHGSRNETSQLRPPQPLSSPILIKTLQPEVAGRSRVESLGEIIKSDSAPEAAASSKHGATRPAMQPSAKPALKSGAGSIRGSANRSIQASGYIIIDLTED